MLMHVADRCIGNEFMRDDDLGVLTACLEDQGHAVGCLLFWRQSPCLNWRRGRTMNSNSPVIHKTLPSITAGDVTIS